MAEREDVRIEIAEDREWDRVREAVDAAEVDLNETYEEFLARTAKTEAIRATLDDDTPRFIVVEA